MKYLAVLSLSLVLSSPLKAEGICDGEIQGFMTKYGKYEDSIKFAKERNTILNKTRWWQKFMGQEVSQAQYQRSKIESFLKFSLKHDRPVIVKEHFEAMSNEVQLAYHIIKKNRLFEEEMAAMLLKNPQHPDLLQMQTKMGDIYKENLKQAKLIAKHLDEYTTTFTTLNKLAEGTDKIAENARFAINKLQSQYILDNFFLKAEIPKRMRKTPAVKEIYQILDEYVEADIYLLKLRKRKEMVAALLSISPTEAFFKAADKVLGKVPWVNRTKFRAFIAEAQDIKLHAKYYPGIERIIMSESEVANRLHLLMTENVSSADDIFLVTFSRRVDAKEKWKEMKNYAEASEPEFFARMVKAEEKAKKMPELSQLKDDSTSKLIIRFLDFAFVSGASGVAYYYYGDDGILKTDKDNKKEEKQEEELDQNLEVVAETVTQMKEDAGEPVDEETDPAPETEAAENQ